MNNLDNDENIQSMYGESSYGSSTFGGVSVSQASICPILPKYSGETVTLQATPRDGIGPYYVVFRKDGVDISPSRLSLVPGGPTGESNPITSATEDITITRVYTLDDVDIASAVSGTINFSVFMSDSCPTSPQTCSETCIITIGCMAPVCNFTVT